MQRLVFNGALVRPAPELRRQIDRQLLRRTALGWALLALLATLSA